MSATRAPVILRDGTERRVEAAILRIAQRHHALQIRGHHVGQAERAAKPSPPAAGKAKRAKQRREERDVAEPHRDLSRRGFDRAGDGERQRLGVGGHAIGRADILVAGLKALRRALVVAAEDEALIGVARRPGAALQMREADGDGEVGTKRQALALRPFGHEHPSADVLARRLQKRVGRMQHRHVDEARAGAVEERAKARRQRRRRHRNQPERCF